MVDQLNQVSDVPISAIAHLDWAYSWQSGRLEGIFAKAKQNPWDPRTAVDWSREVIFGSYRAPLFGPRLAADHRPYDVPLSRLAEFQWHTQAWMISQFLHGEQGALLAAARLVETAPDVGSKLCAASQTLDEAKHVEIFTKYLNEKLGVVYPVDRSLESLLLDVVRDSRWDITYLGMQILVEGAALGSFGTAKVLFEPLAKEIIDLVLRDESRHVAFGMIALSDIYPGLSVAERDERIDFVRSAVTSLRTRFRLQDVRQRLGLRRPANVDHDPFVALFRRRGLSRIPPLLRRLGLWDDSVRRTFDEE